jgi:hypothetical protein
MSARFLLAAFLGGCFLCSVATVPAMAAGEAAAAPDPLIQLLVHKGILTEEDQRTLTAALPDARQAQLVAILRSKGLISSEEEASLVAPPASAQVDSSLVASTSPVVPPMPAPEPSPKPEPPKVVPRCVYCSLSPRLRME